MLPDYVVAVDPGWNVGAFAVFEDGKFVQSAMFNVTKANDKLTALILQASQVLIPKGARRALAIETQYMGQNIGSAIKVIQARMAWQVVGVQNGYEVAEVNPQSWQSRLCSIKKGIGREETGLAYQRVAKLITGFDLKMDEAAAFCIGEYWLGMEKDRLREGGKLL